LKVEVTSVKKQAGAWIAVFDGSCVNPELSRFPLLNEVYAAAQKKGFNPAKAGTEVFTAVSGGEAVPCVLVSVAGWKENGGSRRVFLSMAAAFRACRTARASDIAVVLDGAPSLTAPEIFVKIAGLPKLVDYRFDAYKKDDIPRFETVSFIGSADLAACLNEARVDAEGTLLARNLTNTPVDTLPPARLAEHAEALAKELAAAGLPVDCTISGPDEIQRLSMGCYWGVAKGAARAVPPRLITLRYRGGGDSPVIALIGKGICYDSGGYSLKHSMITMFDDMGGAAAVLGAFRTAVLEKLPLNITVVIAACANLVSEYSYVPGDVLTSMSGRTVEVLSTDAEGRLTLADAMTYALKNENAGTLIEISTLTGSAGNAVGRRRAAYFTNDEKIAAEVEEASRRSCENVWRLPCDEELRSTVDSHVADLRNSVPGNTMGGGAILAALFLREFAEKKPWLHIDMAPVTYVGENQPWCDKGATGWGSSFLYHLLKVISAR
jgi:leucyl aminopeptidase